MHDYTAATYGDCIPEIYDREHPGGPELAPMLRALSELAGDGRALQLRIGTGRVALRLAARGIEVHGIDASEAMVGRLRAKRGGEAIPVTIGDFSKLGIEGGFRLIYAVFNTFYWLNTQEAQLRCFRRVAERLAAGGAFLIEAFVPDLARFHRGQGMRVTGIDPEPAAIELIRHDAVGQRLYSQKVMFTEAGLRFCPARLRYAWPSELDLMARLAGLRLRERWGDWTGGPFTDRSDGHISLYEHAAG